MNHLDIANARLINQQITSSRFTSAKELVSWMGAMQAQDAAMVKWAVGIRLPQSTTQTIETALDKGEIIRTHVLRPTWHLVPADELRWMLALTAPHILAQTKSRQKELELSEAVLKKSMSIIEKILRDGNHLTREEIILELNKGKIATDENRASHIFVYAELNLVICSGKAKAGKQTFALFEERIPKKKSISREDMLAKLAKTYFTSHGPATLQDFIWWSGLSVSQAKEGLELAKTSLNSEALESQTYWFGDSFTFPKSIEASAYLLPAFDEFIISYKDRTATLPITAHQQAISSNGIFWPVIVVNGQAIGTWKRTIKKQKVIISLNFFKQPDKKVRQSLENAAGAFGKFLELEPEIKLEE
ncbi:MAG: winged helix DNA-binding domain-containing protein [Anaerolineales bacterium]